MMMMMRSTLLLLLSVVVAERQGLRAVIDEPREGDIVMTRRVTLKVRLDLIDSSFTAEIFDGRIMAESVHGAQACVKVMDYYERCVPLSDAEEAQFAFVPQTGEVVAETWLQVDEVRHELSIVRFSVGLEAPTTGKVLAVHLGHDANIALVVDGRLESVLELERLTELRNHYLASLDCDTEDFQQLMREALKVVLPDGGPVDYLIEVGWTGGCPGLRKIAPDAQWVAVDHHRAHASLGLHDSPFEKPLILSFDGGGNDGFTHVYAGDRTSGKLQLLDDFQGNLNLGTSYAKVGMVLDEVVGSLEDFTRKCTTGAHGEQADASKAGSMRCALSLPGKMMGYAALGEPREEWIAPMRNFLRHSESWIRLAWAPSWPYNQHVFWGRASRSDDWARGMTRDDVWRHFPYSSNGSTIKEQRDLAATVQRAFQLEVLSLLEPFFLGGDAAYDGVVLVGGCALNVLANSAVEARFGLPVYVPAAPNDSGLSVGGAWLLTPPRRRQPLQYTGPPLFDEAEKFDLMKTVGENFTISTELDVTKLAEKLSKQNFVLGVAIGRAEFGPRALGHRSLLAWPTPEMKDRLNVIKHREWWRPCAPVVAVEDSGRVFKRPPRHATFMSFAPELTDEARAMLPAIDHGGTARVQIVTREDDPWLHALLLAVKKITGWAVLINTSFNSRGKPILNTNRVAIDLLRDTEIDAILLNDGILISKHREAGPNVAAASGARGAPDDVNSECF